jgi:hypothetical protein
MLEIPGIQVLDYLPGRVRLKIRRLKHDPDLARALVGQLIAVDGITRVEANPLTGNLLVRFEARVLAEEVSRRALEGILAEHFPEIPAPQWAELVGRLT